MIVALGFCSPFFNQIFTGLVYRHGRQCGGPAGPRRWDWWAISCWTPDDLRVGPFPRMEVAGAAAATVLAQAIVTATFLARPAGDHSLPHIHPFRPSQRRTWLELLRIGPSGIYPEYVFLQPLHVDRADRGPDGEMRPSPLKRWVPRSNPSPIPRRRALPPR